MEALMAFISIIAVVAIVVVGGGIIAFVTHMVLGVFDGGKQTTKNETKGMIDYSEYKHLENSFHNSYEKEYDFEGINRVKAQKEKEMLAKERDSFYDLEEAEDKELAAIENRLKAENSKKSEQSVEAKPESKAKPIVAPKVQSAEELEDENIDDFDLDNMLNEISNDIIEEEKAQNQAEEVKMSDTLSSYNINDVLNDLEDDFEDSDFEEVEEPVEIVEQPAKVVEEPVKVIEQPVKVVEQPVKVVEEPVGVVEQPVRIIEQPIIVIEKSAEETDEKENKVEEKHELVLPQVEKIIERIEVPIVDESKNVEIAELKAQLEELNRKLAEAREGNVRLEEINKKLEEAQATKTEVVRIDMTEEECVARLETLEDRLKSVKKQYKTNSKEYRPLKKVMNDLEKYQTKLRRKETVVAKKKVSLYGVNNYVDIDKEKAEKLANELELLDGLRLSVSHCEEVINANKDRFPILEHTNQILEDQISHIEADIETTKLMLQKIREQNGEGEDENQEGSEE